MCFCYLHFGCSKPLLGALVDVRARKTLHWCGRADSVDVVQSGAIHLPLQCLIIIVINIVIIISMGCTQIPISTLSHIWVFVRLTGASS